ncbi:MAG TPA: PAS domain S-box protein [Gemmatimonadales bacterium]|nr:PAS domain S-box protein [Gemmatimonadales bacterium]
MEPEPPTDPLSRFGRRALPYGLAIGVVCVGALLRLLLTPVIGAELPFITLFPAVFVAAFYLGFGPTLLATGVSVLIALRFFIDPPDTLSLSTPVAQLGALLFIGTGLSAGWLGEGRVRARATALRALAQAREEADRAEEETIRAEEEAARAEEEALRAEEEATRAEREAAAVGRQIERIERILARIGDAFVVVDRRWLITYLNRSAADLLGGPVESHVGRPFWERFPDDAEGRFGEGYRQAMQGQPVRLSGYYAPFDRWLQVNAFPSDEGMSVVLRDVTDTMKVQEANQRLAAIVVNSEDAIVGKQLDGTITNWNAAAERIFGYAAAEIVGQSIFLLVPPELHPAEHEILERVRLGQPVAFGETERIRKDGSRITIALSVSPIRDAAGRVIGASSIKRDVTAERRALTLLAAETARSRELAGALDLAQVVMLDSDGRITYWSSGAARLYGWSADEAIGRSAEALLQTDFASPPADIHAQLRQHGRWEGDLVHVAKDGRRLWVASQWVLKRDYQGAVQGVVMVDTDQTARREIEERARQSERLEVVGQLAGGVAHEANNQMTVILGAAGFLLRRSDLPAMARQDVEQVRAAAERTAAITGQLLAFSRRQVLQPRVLALDETVLGFQPMLQRTLGERSTVELRLGSADGLVKADPGQLAQVLLNLVLNARDAMPMGGRLSIETSRTQLTEAYGRQHPGVTIVPGPYLVLAVSDTGHGMSRETAARVFEPFYTTKAVGKGTGLGLATVYGIVKQSGGYVWCYSELGKGTTFKVYLPLVAEAASEAGTDTSAPRASGETVLVVEDEPSVRQMTSRTLAELGYRVVEARDGAEALELLGRTDAKVGLMVADVVMPGIDGAELARQVASARPGMAVLFMSGYTDDEVIRRGLLDAGQPFLQKPFTPEALARQVARMLRPWEGHED